ncbi:FHA domain-containing protein [Streptomyces tricolor]|nr:FHA domain-containing protein [Streptomyces tricolor]
MTTTSGRRSSSPARARPHRPAPAVRRRALAGCAVVPAGTAVCPACLSPVGTPGREAGAGRRPERLAGGVLRLVFRTGGRHLDVPRGAELRLGRSSSWAPEASALLAGEETVSGRHATVRHTEDGAAWVTEVAQGATNGTRVNDRVLVPDRAVRLRNGDRVELGPGSASWSAASRTSPPHRPTEHRRTGIGPGTGVRDLGRAGGSRRR